MGRAWMSASLSLRAARRARGSPWFRASRKPRSRPAVSILGVDGRSGPDGSGGPKLLGRTVECEKLDELLSAVRSGRSGALVVRGEAGFGKTALLDYVAARSDGCRLDRAVGVESEMELALRKRSPALAMPLLDRVERLPAPQRDALGTSFGLSVGQPPDPFLVGLAVADACCPEVAETQPLVCLVDDAHWLDHASRPGSRVRRATSPGRVGPASCSRSATRQRLSELAGLPELRLGGLSAGRRTRTARRRSSSGRSTSGSRSDRRGEPRQPARAARAASGVSSASLAGGFALPTVARSRAVSKRASGGRVGRLPERDPTAAARRRRRASRRSSACSGERHRARHRARGGCSGGGGRPDRGRRLAYVPPSASSLGHLPARRRRGAAAAHSELRRGHRSRDRSRSPRLAPRPRYAGTRRGRRRGARALGRPRAVPRWARRRRRLSDPRDRADARCRRSEFAGRSMRPSPTCRRGRSTPRVACSPSPVTGRSTSLQRARIELVRAQLAFASSRGNEATPLLLAAARRLEPVDVGLARETYLDAFIAALFGGPAQRRASASLDVAQAARAAPRRSDGEPTRRRSAAGRVQRAHRRLRDCGSTVPGRVAEALRRRDRRPSERLLLAVAGRHFSLWNCGTTRAGTSCRTVTFSSPGRRARSASYRSRSPRALFVLVLLRRARRRRLAGRRAAVAQGGDGDRATPRTAR